jgi:hypothetical protein
VRGQIQSTIVRLKVPYGPLPRGCIGAVADQHGTTVLVRWLDPLPGEPAHEAPGGTAEVHEDALEGLGLVVLTVPDGPAPGEGGGLWLPGRA